MNPEIFDNATRQSIVESIVRDRDVVSIYPLFNGKHFHEANEPTEELTKSLGHGFLVRGAHFQRAFDLAQKGIEKGYRVSYEDVAA